MKNKLINLLKRPFVKNVFIIASGTAGAQVIAMGLSPIITRLYGPETFGVMGSFAAIINIVAPIAALSYPIAIVLPKKDEDAKGIMRLSLIITMILSAVVLLLLILFGKDLIRTFNMSQIGSYIYLIPLVIIFAGSVQVMEQWLIRTKQFSINARATFYQSIITNLSKVIIGFWYPIASVLLVITAIANGIKAFMMMILSKNSGYVINTDGKSGKTIKELARKYKDFPKYRSPEQLLNAVSNGLPILMLTTFFGPVSAGFYTISRTVLSVPTQLIGKSVGDVFYPRIAEAVINKENLTSLIRKATLALAGVGVIPYGLVIFFGPFLFSFVFGSDWQMAGEYARWIALWLFFGFINRPSVRSLPALSAQRFHLIYTINMLIIRLGALIIAYYAFSNDLIAIAMFGVSGAILNIGLIIITLKISKQRVLQNG